MVRGISEALCTYGSGSRSRGVADIKRIGTNFDKLTRGPTRAMDFETAKKSSCPLSFPFLPFRAPRPLLYLSNPPLPTRPVPFIFFEMTSEVIRWGNYSEDWKLRLKWNCQLAFSFSPFVWEKIKRRKIGEGFFRLMKLRAKRKKKTMYKRAEWFDRDIFPIEKKLCKLRRFGSSFSEMGLLLHNSRSSRFFET